MLSYQYHLCFRYCKISCLKALDLWNFCGIFSFPQTFKCGKGVERGYLMLFNTFSNFSSPASGKY